MKILKSTYKDIFAIDIITDNYCLKILPTEGGKIASFKTKSDGFEYLVQNPCAKYKKLSDNNDFAAAECSGFDDMFPTIDPVTFTDENGREMNYPDHGEVCRGNFECFIQNNSLEMRYISEKLGYEYIKTVREDKNGRIVIDYKITNLNDFALDALWAGHCLIKAEKGGKVITEYRDGESVDLMFDTCGRFGVEGDRLSLKQEYLSTSWTEGVSECRKFYFPQRISKGFLGYEYPDGRTFLMEFDRDKIPYLGIWLNYGALNGYYCVGLEPCSIGYDTILNAKRYGQSHRLASKESFSFSIYLSAI